MLRMEFSNSNDVFLCSQCLFRQNCAGSSSLPPFLLGATKTLKF